MSPSTLPAMNTLPGWIVAWVLTAAPLGAAEPPRLLPPHPTPNGWLLEWTPAAADQAFTVLTSDRLDGLWVMAPSQTPWPLRTNRWADSRPAGPARFYRVLAVTPAERGKVLATASLGTYPKAQLNFLFQLAGIPVTAQYDVTALAVTYETVDPWGGRTQASGLAAWPSAGAPRLPLVSYQHGTLAKKSDAPSQNAAGERLVGLALAATGYLALLPDYLGLGDSPGIPAYHHARSEGTAGVDLLRAARTLAAQRGLNLNGQLFLLGYSHGGHATLALLRELELYHAEEFPVTAAAPMAGAYDLSGVTAEDFLSPRPKPNPYYLALLLAAYQDIYRLAPSLADLLAPPYHITLPPRLTGQHSGGEINALMPADPTQIIRPEYLAAFRADPEHPLRQALRDNDVFRWRPRSPLRLYHCSGDQDVVPANSQVAYAAFRAAGATQVELLDPVPGADHGDCVGPALLSAKAWFDSLRLP